MEFYKRTSKTSDEVEYLRHNPNGRTSWLITVKWSGDHGRLISFHVREAPTIPDGHPFPDGFERCGEAEVGEAIFGSQQLLSDINHARGLGWKMMVPEPQGEFRVEVPYIGVTYGRTYQIYDNEAGAYLTAPEVIGRLNQQRRR